MTQYSDRYLGFRINGRMTTIPGINIPELSSDKTVVYKQGQTRLDKLSQLYYNNAFSGWLIMLANQEFGGLEFNIPDATIIRIPFPYESARARYKEAINKHKLLYG